MNITSSSNIKYFDNKNTLNLSVKSFKSSYDHNNRDYWEDHRVADALRNHLLYMAGAYTCLNQKPHEIETERLSENDNKKLSFDYSNLCKRNIKNMTITTKRKGVSCSYLLTDRHKNEIEKLKESGLEQIIDLREKRNTNNCKELCEAAGLKYVQFPMSCLNRVYDDSIEYLPDFINAIKEGNFYIGCLEGINRTDIALALNYVLNPEEKMTPKLKSASPKSAIKNTKTAIDTMFKKQKDGSYNIPENLLKEFGWKDSNEFLKSYKTRIMNLLEVNNM
ncbi:MAG: hypothetical protein LUG16_04000 [Candidatus Gastranaerophilales bacterium]|nr:hypothetical protein [Candidatus Gastranaerophilales bacterium]